MYRQHTIAVVIPARNAAASIGRVIGEIPGWVDDIIVADNGSTDYTTAVAREAGARVVPAPGGVNGSACLAGIAALDHPDIVVFLSDDFSDYPEEMAALIDPIVERHFDLVVGSRVLGAVGRSALTPQARFGNGLATRLIRMLWGVPHTDLGPFRAIRLATLKQLDLCASDAGWMVEMQIKAALQFVPAGEVPVRYRPPAARRSDAPGIWGASTRILGLIARAALTQRRIRRQSAVVVFTRWPEPGTTKTRLIPVLGPEGAAALQRRMTEDTLRELRPLAAELYLEVRYEGGERRQLRAWLGDDLEFIPQGEGDLGARMLAAFRENFDLAYAKVVLVGSDCPALRTQHLRETLRRLDHDDLVLGPAADGGYYLIGLHLGAHQEDLEALFAGIAWGSVTVRAETIARAEAAGFQVGLLEELRDVDTPEDLAVIG